MATTRLYPDRLALYPTLKKGRIRWVPEGFNFGKGKAALCCRTCDRIMVRGYEPEPVGMPVDALPLATKCDKCGTEYLIPSVRL